MAGIPPQMEKGSLTQEHGQGASHLGASGSSWGQVGTLSGWKGPSTCGFNLLPPPHVPLADNLLYVATQSWMTRPRPGLSLALTHIPWLRATINCVDAQDLLWGNCWVQLLCVWA